MEFLKQENGFGSWWIVGLVALVAYYFGKNADKHEEKKPDPCRKEPERCCRNDPYCRCGRHCNRFF